MGSGYRCRGKLVFHKDIIMWTVVQNEIALVVFLMNDVRIEVRSCNIFRWLNRSSVSILQLRRYGITMIIKRIQQTRSQKRSKSHGILKRKQPLLKRNRSNNHSIYIFTINRRLRLLDCTNIELVWSGLSTCDYHLAGGSVVPSLLSATVMIGSGD